ncbi:Uncharacterized protein TPAR_02563 [Tolypocladium paradoxum]|uniref:CFEM domain-containing protein n=1 Tax=Tolypocladium paradoxum TaxID=94208 RepID=A0A2S4L461_9HYPO|nr:Uncharacterized protein TPAR_02563 [Tolypocladium paradoxum]
MALAAALFASVAAAAVDLAALQKEMPKCSLACLGDAVQSNGCSVMDFACQCSKLEAIMKTVAPCVVKARCDLENITGTFWSCTIKTWLIAHGCAATTRLVLDVCENDVLDTVTVQGASTTSTAAGATHTSAATAVARGAGCAGVAAIVLAAVML